MQTLKLLFPYRTLYTAMLSPTAPQPAIPRKGVRRRRKKEKKKKKPFPPVKPDHTDIRGPQDNLKPHAVQTTDGNNRQGKKKRQRRKERGGKERKGESIPTIESLTLGAQCVFAPALPRPA